MIKRIAGLLVLAVLAVAAVVVVRTLLHTPNGAPDYALGAPAVDVSAAEQRLDADQVARHLAQAIRLRTVSNQDPAQFDASQFEAFIAWARATYPAVHRAMELHFADTYTLLYRWPGADSTLQPVLITGHYDVVPVVPGSDNRWTQPPWEGVVADGVVWGRGALDDKSAVIAQLEAANALVLSGYQPKRTIYLAFGHDEEVGGKGAAAVADHLASQGVQLAWSLDEGSFLFDGMIPGVEPVVASLNLAEKGTVTLQIVAVGTGGHSSMPPKEMAVTRLARALVALDEAPVPGGLSGTSAQMFDTLSRQMGFASRMVFANTWLFGGTIERQLSALTFGNAMLRTTTAPTMLRGSPKSNVLPTEAVAAVNFRIHPRDTVESVLAHVRQVVETEHVKVQLSPGGGNNASSVADVDGPGFALVAASLQDVWGADLVVAPGLTIAATDSRHYGRVSDNAYRLNPMVVTPEDLTGFHGTNEQIRVDNLFLGVRSYLAIMARAGG